MRVLVTCSRTPHALAVIRRLGELGAEVTAADSTRLSCGSHCRFVTRRLRYPAVSQHPQGFVQAVLAELQRRPYDLVFPTFEEIFVLARHRDAIAPLAALHCPPYELLRRVHNKASLTELAASLDIPVPQTFCPVDVAQALQQAEALAFPLVVKPPESNNSANVTVVHDRRQLRRTFERLWKIAQKRHAPAPLLQRFEPGRLLYTLFLADHGRLVGQCVYEPLRMFPDGGGTAFDRRTVDAPEVAAHARRFIAALGWHGFIGFDFIVSPSGPAFLIDANPRPNPAYRLALGAGVDFTDMVLRMTRGQAVAEAAPPQVGVRSKTLFVDLIWRLGQVLPHRDYRAGWRRLREHLRDRRFLPDVHRSDDRKPSWMLALYVIYTLFILNAVRPDAGGFMRGCNFDPARLPADPPEEPPTKPFPQTGRA